MRRLRPVALTLASLALAAGITSQTGAIATSSLSLAPTADATVSATAPNKAFGTAATLRVRAQPTLRSYVTFDPAGAAGPVDRAVLRLTPTSASALGIDVREVPDATWSERTLVYAKQPALGRRIARSGALTANHAIAIDVTTSVRGGMRSFALVPRPGAAELTLAASQSARAAARPRLLVTYTPATSPCGWRTAAPEAPRHVVWVFMENKPYEAIVGSPNAPYENELATGCGLATNYHAVTHPSLPNYIAATSGGTQGITDDANPSSHPLDTSSIYSQVKAAGKTWRDYEESSPGGCPQTSSGQYAVRHDPATYYTGVRTDCAAWDVPLGTPTSGALAADLANDSLPAFAFVTPNLCNDTHDCPVRTGDDWLRAWVPSIVASPAYRSGTTVLVITWDEDDGSATNHVAAIVVAPSVRPGTSSATAFDHYALLKSTEQLLGITTFLGHAADPTTASMLAAFNVG